MGGNFVFKFEADELKMVPKKFYIFNIKSFNEAHFNNARFTTNLRHGNEVGNGDKSKYFSDFTLPSNIFKPNSTMGLTDVSIKGFEWVVVKRDETIFRAVAKKAFLDKQKSNIKMTDIKIDYPLEGRSITAGSASLSTKAKNIAIPGAFIEQSISGTKTGRGIVLDVDFDQSHFNH